MNIKNKRTNTVLTVINTKEKLLECLLESSRRFESKEPAPIVVEHLSEIVPEMFKKIEEKGIINNSIYVLVKWANIKNCHPVFEWKPNKEIEEEWEVINK